MTTEDPIPDPQSPDGPARPEAGTEPILSDLVAYLDGELDGKAQQAIEVKLAIDTRVRAEADSLRKVWDLLDYLPKVEPSPAFTERTLERLIPFTQAVAKVKTAQPTQPTAVVHETVSPTQPMSVWSSWSQRLVSALLWLSASILALIGGYFGRSYFAPVVAVPNLPAKDPDALPLADLRVIENLPLYQSIGEYSFLLQLEASGLFDEAIDTRSDSMDDKPLPGEPDRTTLLRANLIAFEALPMERQQDLRHFDQQLHEQPAAVQSRLIDVMEDFARWRHRLPTDARQQLDSSKTDERLILIRQIREQQLIDRLPIALRQQLENEPHRREALLTEFCRNEQIWREDWLLVKRNWDELKKATFVLPFHDDQFVAELDAYLKNLRPHLSVAEQTELRKTSQQGNLVRYARKVLELSEKYPLLPGPQDGPKTYDQLPPEVRAFLEKQRIDAPRQANFEGTGRWPDFAIQVTKIVRDQGLRLPRELGPSVPDDFIAPEMKLFFTRLDEKMKLKRDRESWFEQQGKWPDFPRAILTASKRFNIPVPGYMLPGPTDKWEKMRVKKRG